MNLNKEMARPEGFEPPTPRFVVWCSIQLQARDRDARARRVACRELDGDRGEPTEVPSLRGGETEEEEPTARTFLSPAS